MGNARTSRGDVRAASKGERGVAVGERLSRAGLRAASERRSYEPTGLCLQTRASDWRTMGTLPAFFFLAVQRRAS